MGFAMNHRKMGSYTARQSEMNKIVRDPMTSARKSMTSLKRNIQLRRVWSNERGSQIPNKKMSRRESIMNANKTGMYRIIV